MNGTKSLFPALLLCCLSLTACKKVEFSEAEVSSTLKAHGWHVTQFSENGVDGTALFTGYVLYFRDGGVCKAVSAADSLGGLWNYAEDDDARSYIHLNMGSDPPFAKLSDDWYVTELSADNAELMDLSGGNGGTDLLYLAKH